VNSKNIEQGLHTGRDTFDTATTSETTDGGLGDTLDVVTQDLTVTLRTTLAETLTTLTTCKTRRSASYSL
jgi:hypothetical protein